MFDDCCEWTRMVGWKMIDLEIQALGGSVGVMIQQSTAKSTIWDLGLGALVGDMRNRNDHTRHRDKVSEQLI